MKPRNLISVTALLLMSSFISAQEDDMLSMIEDSATTEIVTGSFKTDRVINLHSLENTAAGELDIKISHRFDVINNGFYDLFGLDGANIRIGGDYGITDRLMIGAGRSKFEKTYDVFAKFKLLRQTTGARKTPFTVCILGTTAVKTIKPSDPNRENFFTSKLYYTGQLIIGRKFSKAFSLQLSPTIVHRNLVDSISVKNDVLALGAGARFKLGKRTSMNAEYIYVLPNQISSDFQNSMSIGFDIETGGHVFQLHFTNSTSMIEKGFIAETTHEGGKVPIHFGFNLARTFNIK